MRFFALVLRIAARSRRRTLLMAAGVAVSVFVISALLSVEGGFASLVGSAGSSLLAVREKGVACAIGSRVLDSYQAGLADLKGVTGTAGVLRGAYSYQRRENVVIVNGIDFESFRRLKEVTLVDGSAAAFLERGDGALVGRPLASQYGWEVGQTVALEENLTFSIAGLFESADKAYETSVLVHKGYLGRLKKEEGKSTFILVGLEDPRAAAAVSMAIDTSLANFPKPTKTQSERAARERELQDFGEIRRMFRLMILATVLVSVVGAANSVSVSIRERTREVGILRSLGLRRGQVLGILLGEAVLVSAAGGALGVALAAGLLATDRTLGGLVPLTLSTTSTLLAGVAALAIGLLGAALPGLRATRLSIVECLKLAD